MHGTHGGFLISAIEGMHVNGHMSTHITTFRPEHATAFGALNRAWLVKYDLLEAADEPLDVYRPLLVSVE